MNIDKIPIGDNPPDSLNIIIEVPVGGEPVKYEFDKASGALFVDRILHTPMRYPANYGFVPHTLSPDGDPLDALVVARSPFMRVALCVAARLRCSIWRMNMAAMKSCSAYRLMRPSLITAKSAKAAICPKSSCNRSNIFHALQRP